MDGFTASPATGPAPPSPVSQLLLLLRLLQVQGCKPCRTNPPPTKVGRPARQRRTILEPMTLSGRAAS
ncbi:hypothetical protein DKY64_07020 [Stenotrophomonas maltophilia]|nr:hypothetical protein DKY64_07020 [Stenotrophomonas maltophilia]